MPQQGDQCVFCQLINNPQQLKKVAETENFYAWLDINPRAEGYTMVVPKEHVESIMELPPEEYKEGMVLARKVIEKAEKGLNADGATMTLHVNETGGQMLDHAYIQVIPRYEDDENAGTPATALFQPIEMTEQELDQTAEKMASTEVEFDESDPVEPDPESQKFREEERTPVEEATDEDETREDNDPEEERDTVSWE